MSEFFIKRPNFAWVVALFISLAGLLVISKLPVAQYPQCRAATDHHHRHLSRRLGEGAGGLRHQCA